MPFSADYLEPVCLLELPFWSARDFEREEACTTAGQRLWQGLGALLALAWGAWLWPTEVPLPLPMPDPVIKLQLQLQAASPRAQDRELEPVAPTRPTRPTTPIVTSRATSDRQPAAAPRPAAPRLSLESAKAQALRQWQAEQAPAPAGDPVFDSRLAQRLAQIAPAQPAADEPMNLLPGVDGGQMVVLGDYCFVVSKLDDQAMRGMGVWTRGLCQPPRSATRR